MTPFNKIGASSRLKDYKLNTLLDISKAINENLSREELFEQFEEALREKLMIGKMVLFMKEEHWLVAVSFGVDMEALDIDVERDLLRFREIAHVYLNPEPHLDLFDVVIPVFHKAQPLAFLLIGDIDEESLQISPTIKHRPFIETLTNIIVVAIENKKLAKDQLRQEGIRKELELASEMQSMLFPRELPNNDKLQAAAYYQPHQQVGGDYYDYIPTSDHEVVFCMADVSGKGIPAAFLMSNFQAYLRALIKRIPLFYLIQRLNRKVMDSAKGEKFITMFIAKYDYNTRVLNYINAGQNPPLLLTRNEDGMIQSELLKTGCTGLGMFEDLPKVDEGIITIPEGATLLCYTDGVVELENDDGKEFGLDALIKLVAENGNMSMEDLIELVKTALNSYKGNRDYIDDIALLSVKFI
ncbi:MAG: PP2C family protein-serine/threonine phosphatase [Flavobacteriales bacterium]|nr:PP2C family protein-serine/threonine phosphatase [Flavobacteriales bacterium]